MVMNPARHDAAQGLHERIRDTLSRQRANDYQLAKDLHAMNAGRLFVELGCISLREYGERHHRLTPDQTRLFVTLGNRIDIVPAFGEALRDGRIGRTVAKRLAKVVTEQNLDDWLGFSAAASSRELGRLVHHAGPGDSVSTAQRREDEADELVRLVIGDMAASDKDLVLRALTVERERAGLTREQCTNASALVHIVQAYLYRASQDHNHDIPATACRFTKVVHTDEDGVSHQDYGIVSDTDVAMSECDAHQVDMTEGPNRGALTQNIPEVVRRAVFIRDGYRCCVGGCDHWMYLDVHHVIPRQHGGRHDEGNLMTLCSAHHLLHHDGGLSIEHAVGGEARIVTESGHVTVVSLGGDERGRASRDARRRRAEARARKREEVSRDVDKGDVGERSGPGNEFEPKRVDAATTSADAASSQRPDPPGA